MKVQLIKNNNHNKYSNCSKSEASFNGKVDASVKRYIKDIRDGIINAESSTNDITVQNWLKVRNLERSTNLIKYIRTSLKCFMDKTNKDTELLFEFNKNTGEVYPMFKNKKAKIRAYSGWEWNANEEVTANVHGVKAKLPLMIKKDIGDSKLQYRLDDIEALGLYTKSLVENVKPSDIDKALDEKVIFDRVQKLKQQNINK